MAIKWGRGRSARSLILSVVLVTGAAVAIATTLLVSFGRHDATLRIVGVLAFIAACTNEVREEVRRTGTQVLTRFDRSLSQVHDLGREAERRRAAALADQRPLAPVRTLTRRH